jgi:hypothetical protein
MTDVNAPPNDLGGAVTFVAAYFRNARSSLLT